MITFIQTFLREPAVWVAIGSCLTVLFTKLFKRYVRASIESAFVRDMAQNHLPHIYHAQTQQSHALVEIGNALGVQVKIDLDNPPPIQFIREEK